MSFDDAKKEEPKKEEKPKEEPKKEDKPKEEAKKEEKSKEEPKKEDKPKEEPKKDDKPKEEPTKESKDSSPPSNRALKFKDDERKYGGDQGVFGGSNDYDSYSGSGDPYYDDDFKSLDELQGDVDYTSEE